jgi:chemotaxis protein methyltransferase CheR
MTATDLPLGLGELIAERLGLSASGPFRNTLTPVLTKLTVSLGRGLDQLADTLKATSISTDAWQTLIDALTIGETRFLRQRTWFEQVERTILIPLVARRRSQNQKRLRIWCAGCSTGEEPYTVAMLLRRLIADPDSWSIRILASDIRRSGIAAALGGEYPSHQFRELDDDLMGRFCRPIANRRYAIAPDILRMVRFELDNLADIGPGSPHYDNGPYDLIICRNVIMYMVPEMQRRIAGRLCESLSDEGWIAVSAAEAVAEWFQPLDPVNAGEAILFRKKGRGSTRAVKLRSAKTIEVPLRWKEPETPPARPRPVETLPIAPEPQGLDYIRRIADLGRLDEAAALCREFVQRDNMNGQAAILLAAILIEVGDHDSALESARRAVYLEPSSVAALNLLAGALLKIGHTGRARRTFAAAERLAEDLAAASSSDRSAKATGVLVDEMDHSDGA